MRLRHISFFEILETWNFNLGENLIFHPPTSKSLTFFKKNVLIYFIWSSSVICSSRSHGALMLSAINCLILVPLRKRTFEILPLILIITLPLTVSARGCIDIRENWQTQAMEPIIKGLLCRACQSHLPGL